MIEAIQKFKNRMLCCASALFATALVAGCADTPSDSMPDTSTTTSSGTATEIQVEMTPEPSKAEAPQMVVHHDPNCGCCGKWIEHMEQHGFAVQSVLETDMNAVKRELGVPENLPSCHTATVDGYVIEGHVPAADVQRLLAERPDAKGLSVPGMPLGSPGMEYNNQRQAYNVVVFDESGDQSVFNHYPELID